METLSQYKRLRNLKKCGQQGWGRGNGRRKNLLTLVWVGPFYETQIGM